jgi:hypothetical protein
MELVIGNKGRSYKMKNFINSIKKSKNKEYWIVSSPYLYKDGDAISLSLKYWKDIDYFGNIGYNYMVHENNFILDKINKKYPDKKNRIIANIKMEYPEILFITDYHEIKNGYKEEYGHITSNDYLYSTIIKFITYLNIIRIKYNL